MTALRETGREVCLTVARPPTANPTNDIKASLDREQSLSQHSFQPEEDDFEEDYSLPASTVQQFTPVHQETEMIPSPTPDQVKTPSPVPPQIRTPSPVQQQIPSPVHQEDKSTSPLSVQQTRTSSPQERTPSPSRTPTPVQSFLKDAGLGSVEATPQPTPRKSMENHNRGEEEEEEDSEDGEEEEEDEYEVELVKGARGLGFTVAGGAQSTGFFYVKDVLYDPALSAGVIQPGDRLIQVGAVLDLLGFS